MKIKLFHFLFIILFFSLFHPDQGWAQWTITKVDWRFEVGAYNSIAVNRNNDNVHISYYNASDSHPKYANTDSCSWTNQTLEGPGGNYGVGTSIALDSNGDVHISYFAGGPQHPRYATNAYGGWTYEWVPPGLNSAGQEHTSIAVDTDNNTVYVAYTDWWNQVRYAYRTYGPGGTWTEHVPIATGGSAPSIAVDNTGVVHMAFIGDNARIKYTNSSNWVVLTDVSPVGFFSSPALTMDSNNRAHITWYDRDGRNLMYNTNDSGAWFVAPQVVDSAGDVGRNPSIAIDSMGNAHISYDDISLGMNERVKYATNASGGWVSEIIPTFGIRVRYSSIAVDSNNNVHISFQDISAEDLYYATTAFADIGLRVYDGTNAISIACEPSSSLTSPLRIRKGANTYGIMLLELGDPCASKVKIKTPTGTKALRKIP